MLDLRRYSGVPGQDIMDLSLDLHGMMTCRERPTRLSGQMTFALDQGQSFGNGHKL